MGRHTSVKSCLRSAVRMLVKAILSSCITASSFNRKQLSEPLINNNSRSVFLQKIYFVIVSGNIPHIDSGFQCSSCAQVDVEFHQI